MSRPGGELQRRVRATMVDAGGYWRPLAAVARLLEELGELAELPTVDRGALAGELADLWIITTALADQFLAEVPPPGSGNRRGGATVATLLAAAGPIARIVNHYDGPKVPRGTIGSLAEAIASFHGELGAFASEHGVELAAAVAAKLGEIRARGDIERFGRDGFDASTAPVLAASTAPGLPSRLWGAPDLGPRADAAERAAAARGPLETFAKAARAERLDGFVIAGPETVAAAAPGAWLGALVAAIDPAGEIDGFTVSAAPLRASWLLEASGRVLALIEPGRRAFSRRPAG